MTSENEVEGYCGGRWITCLSREVVKVSTSNRICLGDYKISWELGGTIVPFATVCVAALATLGLNTGACCFVTYGCTAY